MYDTEPIRPIKSLLEKLVPLEVAQRMQDERKKANRQKEIEEIDSWLMWLFRTHPLRFWLLGIGVGLALWAFSSGFAAFLDWLAR